VGPGKPGPFSPKEEQMTVPTNVSGLDAIKKAFESNQVIEGKLWRPNEDGVMVPRAVRLSIGVMYVDHIFTEDANGKWVATPERTVYALALVSYGLGMRQSDTGQWVDTWTDPYNMERADGSTKKSPISRVDLRLFQFEHAVAGSKARKDMVPVPGKTWVYPTCSASCKDGIQLVDESFAKNVLLGKGWADRLLTVILE
jgi:hypothetical protein